MPSIDVSMVRVSVNSSSTSLFLLRSMILSINLEPSVQELWCFFVLILRCEFSISSYFGEDVAINSGPSARVVMLASTANSLSIQVLGAGCEVRQLS